MTTVSASPSEAPESTRLTDGFRLVVDALEANDIETIYGVVGRSQSTQ
jgi:oxalyl-CoA decarboxylase